MIVFDLGCSDCGTVTETWFRSSADYDDQSGRGLVHCAACGSNAVAKAPMAPGIPAKGSGRSSPIERLAALQARILEKSEWVGERFAAEARDIHLGDAEERPIHGIASVEDTMALIDEGVKVAPLPFPVAAPNQVN